MNTARILLDACTHAIDQYKRTLEQPGLVSVRLFAKFDDDGHLQDFALTPEFATMKKKRKDHAREMHLTGTAAE